MSHHILSVLDAPSAFLLRLHPVGPNIAAALHLPFIVASFVQDCRLNAVQICTLAQYGPSRWLSAWNIIDICTYVFQILISIAYFGRCVLS